MEAWWEKFESMCESWTRECEERRRFWVERDAAHERYLAEQAVRYEAKAAAAIALAEEKLAVEAEREATAEVKRAATTTAEAERAMTVKEEKDGIFIFQKPHIGSSMVVPMNTGTLIFVKKLRSVSSMANRPPAKPPDSVEREAVATEHRKRVKEKPQIGSSTARGILNESTVLPVIDTVLLQIDVVLPQIDVILPQVDDLGFKGGGWSHYGGVLGDCGGDSAIDGARRPPRKPPDSFFCSGDLCFLVADSWRLVLCVLIDLLQIDDLGVSEWFQLSNSGLLGDDSPQYGGDVGLGGVVLSQVAEFASGRGRRPPRQPPDFLLCGEDLCFLTGDPCKMVMARRPPAKPPDVAVSLIPWWGQLDTAAWCKPCKRGRGLRRDMAHVRGKMLDPSFPWEWAKPNSSKAIGPCRKKKVLHG